LQIPVDGYRLPAALAKGTFEEKVKAGFLIVAGTKSTVIVIKMHLLSFENISGAQAITKKEPKEEFVLAKITGGPKPAEQRGGVHRPLKKRIAFFCLYICLTPNCKPNSHMYCYPNRFLVKVPKVQLTDWMPARRVEGRITC
jgi:hypothetical protein